MTAGLWHACRHAPHLQKSDLMALFFLILTRPDPAIPLPHRNDLHRITVTSPLPPPRSLTQPLKPTTTCHVKITGIVPHSGHVGHEANKAADSRGKTQARGTDPPLAGSLIGGGGERGGGIGGGAAAALVGAGTGAGAGLAGGTGATGGAGVVGGLGQSAAQALSRPVNAAAAVLPQRDMAFPAGASRR